MQKITPFLWFGKDAEKAAKFYTSVFPDSKVLGVKRYDEESANAAGMPPGSVLTVAFRLLGQDFTALNGGPIFKFNESMSFFVYCKTQRSLDGLFRKLSRNGKILQPLGKYFFAKRYAFFQDRFGVAWQLILSPGRPHIAPCLLFLGKNLGNGEAAVKFYTSVFKKAKIRSLLRYGKGEDNKPGSLKHSSFVLEGMEFVAMEGGGPDRSSFNESVSFMVSCRTQAEIDYYWKKLTHGGQEGQCGWLKDKYGVSWQIVPAELDKMLSGPKREKVMGALLKMKKLDIKKFKQAMK
jgi:predicted 3-demethylubiquinone-9 3-methyltransferase (glyoxalase superfamily)